MTTLPSSGTISAVTDQVSAKTYYEQMRDFIAELFGGSPWQNKTIVSGSVTPTTAATRIDTEFGATTDDLNVVVYTNHPEGRFIIIGATSDARVITVKHGTAGDGHIELVTGSDFILNSTKKFLVLTRIGTVWYEVLRNYGNDSAALRSFLQLGSAALATLGNTGANLPSWDQIGGGFVAQGKHSIWVPSFAMTPWIDSPSSFHTRLGGTYDTFMGLSFDPDVVEAASFSILMPKSWNAGSVTAQIIFTSPGGSGNVRWSIWVSRQPVNTRPTAWISQVDGGFTVNSVAFYDQRTTEFSLSLTGGAKEDLLNFVIRRASSHTGDTYTDDVYLKGVLLKYTMNAKDDS